MTQAIKPTTRLTLSTHRECGRTRAIVVTVHPTWLAFRLLRGRRILQLDIEAAYQYAAKLQAAKARAELAQARKAKQSSPRRTSGAA